jgi:hypothetical protein
LLSAGAFSVLAVEQVSSVTRSARGLLFEAADEKRAFRVVSLNCNAGSKLAAAETLRVEPDIVLLQESPSQETIVELAAKLHGDEGAVLWSADCSIIARGKLQPSGQSDRHFLHATWTRVNGEVVEVICVRLAPPIVNYSLWSPTCWREHLAARRQHRQETKVIASTLAEIPPGRPILLGGDCNCPAGDGALHEWSPRLLDAFDSAGHGWE